MKDLSPRQESILNRVVDAHIETGQPVGSKHITELYTEMYRRSYSSATVRNEMLRLEEKGYLTHPHTSAGRIPTDRGYRYYVDTGLRAEPISSEVTDRLSQDLEPYRERFEFLVNRASLMLSQFSGLMSLILVTDEETELQEEDAYFSIRGMNHMLEQTEDIQVKSLGGLLQFFEDRPNLYRWLLEISEDRNLSIAIGRENEETALQDCSVISCPILREGARRGMLAVIGPRRMRYGVSVSWVDQMAKTLSRILESSGDF